MITYLLWMHRQAKWPGQLHRTIKNDHILPEDAQTSQNGQINFTQLSRMITYFLRTHRQAKMVRSTLTTIYTNFPPSVNKLIDQLLHLKWEKQRTYCVYTQFSHKSANAINIYHFLSYFLWTVKTVDNRLQKKVLTCGLCTFIA